MKCNVFIFFLFVSQFSFAQNCDIEPIKHLMQKEQFALVYSLAERLMDCNLSKSDKEFVQFNQAKSSLELFTILRPSFCFRCSEMSKKFLKLGPDRSAKP